MSQRFQRNVEAARRSLELVGEGDWTPQDSWCARLANDVEELLADAREYHEALNGLWVAFGREFREDADLYVVRRMVERLAAGHKAHGFSVSAAVPVTGAKP